jgi:hypothetical protein
MASVKTLLREPLVHFLLFGVGLFLAFGMVNKRTSAAPETIVVTRGQIESMAAGFTRTWQRPPTDEELEGLIRDHVREEVYYRAAVAMGLDRDDTIIRRRLRQKMEFISEGVGAEAEPTDGDLRAFLRAHPGTFRVERRFTFRQVYLNPDRHGGNLRRDAVRLLARLNRPGGEADVTEVGDPSLLEQRLDAVPAGEVAKQFGEKFASALSDVALGRWQGPIDSGYGAHLVFVAERTDERVPALEEVRDAVRRQWMNLRRENANEQLYARLLERYTVTVEQPRPRDGEEQKLAAMRSR